MPKIKITKLPIGEKECEVEREILDFMEGKGEVALTDIVHKLDGIPWSATIMGIGALVQKGLVAYKGQNQYVLLNNETS